MRNIIDWIQDWLEIWWPESPPRLFTLLSVFFFFLPCDSLETSADLTQVTSPNCSSQTVLLAEQSSQVFDCSLSHLRLSKCLEGEWMSKHLSMFSHVDIETSGFIRKPSDSALQTLLQSFFLVFTYNFCKDLLHADLATTHRRYTGCLPFMWTMMWPHFLLKNWT